MSACLVDAKQLLDSCTARCPFSMFVSLYVCVCVCVSCHLTRTWLLFCSLEANRSLPLAPVLRAIRVDCCHCSLVETEPPYTGETALPPVLIGTSFVNCPGFSSRLFSCSFPVRIRIVPVMALCRGELGSCVCCMWRPLLRMCVLRRAPEDRARADNLARRHAKIKDVLSRLPGQSMPRLRSLPLSADADSSTPSYPSTLREQGW